MAIQDSFYINQKKKNEFYDFNMIQVKKKSCYQSY